MSNASKTSAPLLVLIPAAGVGKRFGADRPKQYCQIRGDTVLDITLTKMLALPGVSRLVLALAEGDPWWKDSEFYDHPAVHAVEGGEERADSVLAGLAYLSDEFSPDSRVLVPDAARPFPDRVARGQHNPPP